MWPFFVVFSQPAFRPLPHLGQLAESIHVQDFVTVGSIKPFDVGVLSGLAGFNELEFSRCSSARSAKAVEMNSGQLSIRSFLG